MFISNLFSAKHFKQDEMEQQQTGRAVPKALVWNIPQVNRLKEASSNGPVLVSHKQGWSKVPHCVKKTHDCRKDIITLAQEHLVKLLSVQIIAFFFI